VYILTERSPRSAPKVRRADRYVYHLACFTCDICLRQLSTGEQFTIERRNQNAVRLLCRLHFAVDNQQQELPIASSSRIGLERIPSPQVALNYSYGGQIQSSTSCSTTKFNQDQYLELLASNSSQTSKSLGLDGRIGFEDSVAGSAENNLIDEIVLSSIQRADTSTSSSNEGSTNGAMGMPSKSKRVRTTFTEDQLSILQTHFQIDSNPDGQDLERIATITGLSKRVTQVWFQNSRARQKKYMIKRKPSGSISISASLNATGGSSLQFSQHHPQTHQESMAHDEGYSARVPLKWSNMSDRSDFSLDATGTLGEADGSRSSDDQDRDKFSVSEDSSD